MTKKLLITRFLFITFMGVGHSVFASQTKGAAPVAPRKPDMTRVISQPASTPSSSNEEWKGIPGDSEISIGALTGLGVLDSSAGFAVLATAGRRIVPHGFVPDINNSVYLEAMVGPLFLKAGTAFAYSVHLRWDFQKNDPWIFYALGGLGGDITGAGLGNRFLLFPRFGIGALWQVYPQIHARAELSHELTTMGIAFSL